LSELVEGTRAKRSDPIMGGDAVVQLESVRKRFGGERNGVVALEGMTLALGRASFKTIMGPSASAKITLLRRVRVAHMRHPRWSL
jgi:putative ABC transport system ATP-binding protein